MNVTPILILAAGASTRMGYPKQLTLWNGQPLLRHVAQEALSARLGPVHVVLGNDAEACRQEIADLPVTAIFHPDWREGMGSSLAAGTRYLHAENHGRLLLMLGDQPLVSGTILRDLAKLHEERGAQITACEYAETAGPPAIFEAAWFPALTATRGDRGAKMLFTACLDLALLPCAQAAFDLDTGNDLESARSLGVECSVAMCSNSVYKEGSNTVSEFETFQ